MKNFFRFFAVCMVAMLGACSEGDSVDDLSFSVETPEVTGVTQRGAIVSAQANFDLAAYPLAEVGFLYGLGTDVQSKYREVKPSTSGERSFSVTLSGLEPDSEYCVYSFVKIGQTIFPSEECATFTTQPLSGGGDDKRPEIDVAGNSTITVGAAGGEMSILYSLYNAEEGATVTAGAEDAWVRDIDDSKTGVVTFTVEENRGAARSTTMELSYGDAREAYITISQEGFDDPEPTPVDPTFGTPAVSSVTTSGAVLSASFGYDGEVAVKSVYFSLKPSGGAEQKISLTTVAGQKSATVQNLQENTTYTFCLAVEVNDKVYKSVSKSFTTEKSNTGGGGGVTDSDAKYGGWPELLAEDDNSDYYYAYHFCPDFKIGSYNARNYAVCFSAKHHCPVWVAAPRHDCYEGGANRTNAYAKDPDIPSSIQYNNKNTGGGCNKGHMLGSAERTRSTAINKQVFYYTNIAPQYSSGFNTGGGGWNTLEDWIDGKVCRDTTYLVIGTYFEKFTDGYGHSASPKKISFGGRSDVSCPTMFYIAVLRTKRGNTGKSVLNCSADELMAAAFVRAHNNGLKGQKVTSREMMSIDDLEKLTGFDFFPNVPNAPEASFNPSDWGL